MLFYSLYICAVNSLDMSLRFLTDGNNIEDICAIDDAYFLLNFCASSCNQ